MLSENQILYIYSSLAQVIGALLGLTIAGYSMIDSKMKSFSESDITVTEYIEDIRHSLDIDKSVNPTIYKELNETYTLLKAIYDAQVTEDDLEFKEKQLELKQYSKAHGYNEIDKKILDFMKANPNTSLRDISEHTNYTISTICCRISNLQKIGTISKIGEGRQSRWQINSNIL